MLASAVFEQPCVPASSDTNLRRFSSSPSLSLDELARLPEFIMQSWAHGDNHATIRFAKHVVMRSMSFNPLQPKHQHILKSNATYAIVDASC